MAFSCLTQTLTALLIEQDTVSSDQSAHCVAWSPFASQILTCNLSYEFHFAKSLWLTESVSIRSNPTKSCSSIRLNVRTPLNPSISGDYFWVVKKTFTIDFIARAFFPKLKLFPSRNLFKRFSSLSVQQVDEATQWNAMMYLVVAIYICIVATASG